MSIESQAGVVITTKDIYDKLIDVEKSVTLMTPQAQTVTDHEARLRVVEAALPEHLEKRLLALEKWKWSIPATAVTAILAIVEQYLLRKP